MASCAMAQILAHYRAAKLGT
ncbi:hypothetical protein MexAM1_META1p3815 [Methylorubrum extorquens AM1]|uniref:Uncharacterized protein n=1 Tax=Methylorubrum extorquens (strain ATCC 14718 / DSM 1338 / JCM 2805 / NCIMB 9133 / AM1) TaxID=272630 RepID=C5AZY5_METEA|nr:hypothetical protein MexAM1_META1p3815 [Methylorubrum extorquens AM1]